MPDDLRRVEIGLAPGFGKRALDALLESVEIIARVLAGQEAVFRIEQHALRARRVVDHAAAEFGAVGTANDERAHRVCSEIDAYGEHQRSRAPGL